MIQPPEKLFARFVREQQVPTRLKMLSAVYLYNYIYAVMKKIIILASLCAFLLIPVAASAQLTNAGKLLGQVANPTGLQSDLSATVSMIIKTALYLVSSIFLILTIYAGYLWMTAAGSEEHIKKAKGIIMTSIIGLVITLSAYAIASFVTNRLSGAPTVSTGTPGCCYNTAHTVCASLVQSECNVSADVTWAPGACPSDCK